MKIYVACPSSYMQLAVATIAKVRAAGHTITHDWTKAVERDREVSFDNAQLAQSGFDDIRGVRDAEVVIVMVTWASGPQIGCAVEIGAALALGIPIILVELADSKDTPWERHPFRHCCTSRVRNLDEVLTWSKGR